MMKFYRFSHRAALLIVCAVFVVLTAVGCFSTAAVEIGFSEDNSEHVVFLPDHAVQNLLIGALAVLAACVLTRVRVTKALLTVLTLALLIGTTVYGMLWISSVHASPGADSSSIVTAAVQMVRGETEALRDTPYFRMFPFQLGYLLYAETFCRLFGEGGFLLAMGCANVLFLDAAYLALLAITRTLFHDDTVSFLTILLLLFCWQPLFFTTFLYGFLPGLSFALWGVYFVLRAIHSEKFGMLLPAALLLALAVLLKKNYLIVLIAVCIALLLHCASRRRAKLLCGAALIAACALLLPPAVQRGYEARIGTSFGRGTPQTAWLVTGVSESSFCSGWFSSYTVTVLKENDYDQARTKRQIQVDLKEELSKFRGRPRYLAAFFYHKITGQWNEPQFQSVWSSAAGMHTSSPAPWVEQVYQSAEDGFLFAFFDRYMFVVYATFAAGMLLLALNKRAAADEPAGEDAPGLLILPVTVLGAFLYHAAFEAKAQYSLVYLPMLLPYAAYALRWIGGRLQTRAMRLISGKKRDASTPAAASEHVSRAEESPARSEIRPEHM